MSGERYDYVIVGAGTAGCLLANRLTADPSIRVLLLEAGQPDDWIWVRIPVGYLYCIGNPRIDWMFETGAEAGLNGRSLRYPRGKVLGGCSSINGMIYMRGQQEDYDGWAAQGNSGWTWEEVLPYFLKHEDHHGRDGGAADPYHGRGGEWRVEKMRVSWPVLDTFREAAFETGIPPVVDFNRGDNFGCGYFEVNQRRGVRWNTARAFLRPVERRMNLRVITGAQVTRLRLHPDSMTVEGVEFKRDNGSADSEYALASAEVVLTAGAIGTPHLMQLSGIGPHAVLADAGIVQRLDEPGVGGNLQDHLQLRLTFRVANTRTLNERANRWWGKAMMAGEYLARRSGPMAMAPSQLGAFARSSDDLDRPDLEYHVQPLSLDKFGEPLHDYPAITASVCHLRPESRGSIRARSPDPSAAPEIRPNYLSTEADRQVAVAAIRLTRRIMAAPAFQPFSPTEVRPGPALVDDEALAKAAGDIGTTIFHPVGTCKMGPVTDPTAVVDHRLRAHRIAGLRIADASVMPTITSGNTNAPTLMIAERAAEMILADRQRG